MEELGPRWCSPGLLSRSPGPQPAGGFSHILLWSMHCMAPGNASSGQAQQQAWEDMPGWHRYFCSPSPAGTLGQGAFG